MDQLTASDVHTDVFPIFHNKKQQTQYLSVAWYIHSMTSFVTE